MVSARRLTTACLVLTIGVAAVLDAVVATSMDRTYDEAAHVAYGLRILHGQPDRASPYFDSKEPVTALNAVPAFIAEHLGRSGASARTLALLRGGPLSRVASILALLLLNVVVYRWAYELYGPAAGLAASVMVVASPNLIAHGTLATTDGYMALGVLGSLYVFRRYLLRPTLGHALLSALALALAQLTKPFAIYLYPIAGLFLLLAVVSGTRTSPPHTRRSAGTYIAACLVLFVVVTDAAYAFDRPLTAFSAYSFASAPFVHLQQLAQHWPMLRSVRVPVAYPYLQGLDMTARHEATGDTFGNIYLLGHLGHAGDPRFRGFASYYAVAVFFKEPIALQILAVLGLVWIVRRRTAADILQGEGVLLCAGVALVLWLSFFDRAQIGIRHILSALAVIIVIASAAFSDFATAPRWRRIGLGSLVLWLCVSMASYYPQLIPYMNEWIPDRTLAYRILGDSNLQYGQNASLVSAFLRSNPDVAYNPAAPVCGRVLVSVDDLVGILPRDRPPPAWLLARRPVADVGYADLLYVIPCQAGAPQ